MNTPALAELLSVLRKNAILNFEYHVFNFGIQRKNFPVYLATPILKAKNIDEERARQSCAKVIYNFVFLMASPFSVFVS